MEQLTTKTNIKIINNQIDEISSLSQEEREREKRKKDYRGHKSLVRYLWCWNVNYENEMPSLIKLAKLGDTFIKEGKEHVIRSIAKQLSLRVVLRLYKDVSDYQIRKALAKYRIGKNTYYLIPYKKKTQELPQGVSHLTE